jgi:hypothetical protein
MKKTIYVFGFLLLAGSLVFTACNKDDEDDPTPVDLTPTLTFIGGAGYTDADATLDAGSTFKVGINAAENAESKKNIETFKVVRTFNNVPVTVYEENDINEPNYTWEDDLTANAEVGEERWSFTVTDKDGLSKELAINITTEAATTPLGNAEALTWERVAGNPATGLAMFGLKWENNLKEVMAVIEKDGADKFVQLTPANWTDFTTVEELAAAVEDADDMDEYKGISAEVNQTYDEVLATMYNGEYYLIHLTEATIDVQVAGTTITITGEYKK